MNICDDCKNCVVQIKQGKVQSSKVTVDLQKIVSFKLFTKIFQLIHGNTVN